MELKDVLSTYTKMVLFGLGAGIFATAVFLTAYYLWYPVFDLVASPQDVNRLIGDMFIGDPIAGASTGCAIYIFLLASTLAYGDTMFHFGIDGAHETGPRYAVNAFLGPFLLIVVGALATSAGAVTCRTVIRKKRPADRDLRDAALGAMGLIALIVAAPLVAALLI